MTATVFTALLLMDRPQLSPIKPTRKLRNYLCCCWDLWRISAIKIWNHWPTVAKVCYINQLNAQTNFLLGVDWMLCLMCLTILTVVQYKVTVSCDPPFPAELCNATSAGSPRTAALESCPPPRDWRVLYELNMWIENKTWQSIPCQYRKRHIYLKMSKWSKWTNSSRVHFVHFKKQDGRQETQKLCYARGGLAELSPAHVTI